MHFLYLSRRNSMLSILIITKPNVCLSSLLMYHFIVQTSKCNPAGSVVSWKKSPQHQFFNLVPSLVFVSAKIYTWQVIQVGFLSDPGTYYGSFDPWNFQDHNLILRIFGEGTNFLSMWVYFGLDLVRSTQLSW